LELNYDTARSETNAVVSSLRHEDLDEVLVMDWWFDSEMPRG
jgi:hypothetical protein